MSIDPRTPVLVGCGQVLQRAEDPARAEEPLALMERAARAAAEDAGAPSLLAALDSVRVPRGLWRYANPGVLLRERFGSPGARTAMAPISGSSVQVMVARGARDIAAGKRDVILVVGAECEHSRRRLRAAGLETRWTRQDEAPAPDEDFGPLDPGFGWWEKAFRVRPVQAFSLYENALRHHRGESIAAGRERIARLWARFAAVAADNPYAWIRHAPDARALATVGDDNRMVAFPYTKYLVANMVVDQGAAVILCSAEAARRHGVPEERFVYPHAATDVVNNSAMPERVELHDQPALGLAGRRVLELAEASPDGLAHVDLYSCFPSAVQIAAAELGFDLARDLTVTGGLTFAGGPFNSYTLHSMSTLMGRLRDDPGARGLMSGIGGYMAKHAFGVYGSEPPEKGFCYRNLDDEAQALPKREALPAFEGPVRVEAFAVLAGRDGAPDRVLAACRTPDDARAWGICSDPQLVSDLEKEELCGREGRLAGQTLELA